MAGCELVAEVYDPMSEFVDIGVQGFAVPRLSAALLAEHAYDPLRLEQALRYAACPVVEVPESDRDGYREILRGQQR